MEENIHISVLHDESIDALDLSKKDIVIDGTLGGAGHSESICKELGEEGMLIAFDLDSQAIEKAREKLKKYTCRKELLEDNFKNARLHMERLGLKVDGVLLDLGYSSNQLESGGRGISFQKDEPLLMTLKDNPGFNDLKAYDIVNTWDEVDIANIIFRYGEERFSRRIAREIVETRSVKPIQTTFELVELVKKAIPRRFHPRRINPATKTFQAIRIAVNDELGSLELFIKEMPLYLAQNGRVAIITFHSLEDRIVKHMFRDLAEKGFGEVITRKPMLPTPEELDANPRSRSAKLRIFEYIPQENNS
jgi:16S rRNA (cytosine1402-N4)-methyltransferase